MCTVKFQKIFECLLTIFLSTCSENEIAFHYFTRYLTFHVCINFFLCRVSHFQLNKVDIYQRSFRYRNSVKHCHSTSMYLLHYLTLTQTFTFTLIRGFKEQMIIIHSGKQFSNWEFSITPILPHLISEHTLCSDYRP